MRAAPIGRIDKERHRHRVDNLRTYDLFFDVDPGAFEGCFHPFFKPRMAEAVFHTELIDVRLTDWGAFEVAGTDLAV